MKINYYLICFRTDYIICTEFIACTVGEFLVYSRSSIFGWILGSWLVWVRFMGVAGATGIEVLIL